MPQYVPHAQCPFYRNDYTIPAANMQAAFGQVFTTYPGVSKTQNSYRKAVMKHNGEHTGRHVRQDPAKELCEAQGDPAHPEYAEDPEGFLRMVSQRGSARGVQGC